MYMYPHQSHHRTEKNGYHLIIEKIGKRKISANKMIVKTYTLRVKGRNKNEKRNQGYLQGGFLRGKNYFWTSKGKIWLADEKYLKLLLHTRACLLSSVAETKLFVLATVTA
jgi:hypothetical protein